MPFPEHVVAPERLVTDHFVLRPITADDAERDHAAVMATRRSLRLWEQSTWPEDDFTVEANRDDLARMERRRGGGHAFDYTVLDPSESECLGCVYVFAHDAGFLAAADVTAVDTWRWEEIGAAVYFWVRASRTEDGLDRVLLAELREWFEDAWRLDRVVYVVSEPFTLQVDLLRSTDLELRFELREPDKPAPYLAFG